MLSQLWAILDSKANPTCAGCLSSVRTGSVIHPLSTEPFGESVRKP